MYRIFNFFKDKKPIEPEIEIEKISFEEIRKWVENKNESLRRNKQEILREIKKIKNSSEYVANLKTGECRIGFYDYQVGRD